MIVKYLANTLLSLKNELKLSGYFIKPIGKPDIQKEVPYLVQTLSVFSKDGSVEKKVTLHIDGTDGIFTGQYKAMFRTSYPFALENRASQTKPSEELLKFLKLRVSSLSSQNKIQELSNRIARLENMKIDIMELEELEG